jgi:tetratricopeptide (TPR) repeat protein
MKVYLEPMRPVACLALFVSGALAQSDDPSELLRKGIAAQERGQFAAAVEAYQQVLEKRSDLTQARVNLAAALAEMGRLDETISVLEAAPPRDREKAEVRRNLALAYYRKGDLPAAIGQLTRLPADVQTVSLLADCYLRSGAPAKALGVLEPAAAQHPDDASIQYQLGMARIRASRPKDALDPLERAGKLGRSAEAYLLAGATALDAGEFQRARNDLESAIRLNPKLPGAWTWTGMARDRVSDEEGAKQAFRSALQLNDGDFEANLHLGAILYRERDIQAARPYLERALSIQPSSNLALYALALVRSASGEMDQSIRDLETVTRAAPEWAEPHVKLASLYFRLRRDAEGRREQEIAENLRSEHRDQAVPLPELQAK